MKIVSIVYLSGLLISAILPPGLTAQRNIRKDAVKTDTINLQGSDKGVSFEIAFVKGQYHNHPTFAIWLEDMNGNYLRTVFVTKSIGTGIFGHGRIQKEVWDNKPGPQKRPATLPYWLHKRSAILNLPLLPDSAHPVLDGYTGATPLANFVIKAGAQESLPRKVRILMEINQPWDWNEYWTNNLYDDPDYRTSCQPSVIYSVSVDMDNSAAEYFLNPIGHGQYAGKDGILYTDLRTLTTGLKIIDHVSVKLINLKEK